MKSPIEQLEEALAAGRALHINPDGTVVEGPVEEPVMTAPLTRAINLGWEY